MDGSSMNKLIPVNLREEPPPRSPKPSRNVIKCWSGLIREARIAGGIRAATVVLSRSPLAGVMTLDEILSRGGRHGRR